MHRHTTSGQWAAELLQCTATLPEGSGQWNCCIVPPHSLGAVGSGIAATQCLTASGVVGGGTAAMHCHSAWGQWAAEPLQRTSTLSAGSGQWDCYHAPPHCLWAVGSGTHVRHCHTARGGLLQCIATLPGGSGQGTPVMHCHTAWGQFAGNPCNAPPHCLGAVGSGSPAMHCHTASGVGSGTAALHRLIVWGKWAAELLQRTASLPRRQWAVELLQCATSLPHCLTA